MRNLTAIFVELAETRLYGCGVGASSENRTRIFCLASRCINRYTIPAHALAAFFNVMFTRSSPRTRDGVMTPLNALPELVNALSGAGGGIRTHEAFATAYKTVPIDHYGTPAYKN